MNFNDNRVISISTAIIAVTSCLALWFTLSNRSPKVNRNRQSEIVDKKPSVQPKQLKSSIQNEVLSPKKLDTPKIKKTAPVNVVNPSQITKGDSQSNLVTPNFFPFRKTEIVIEGSNLTTPTKFPSVAVLAIDWGGTIRIGFSGKRKLVQLSETVTVVSKTMRCDFSFGAVNSGASSVRVKTYCDEL